MGDVQILAGQPASPFPPLAVGSVGLGTGYLVYGPQELAGYPRREERADFATGMWCIWMPGFMQFITGVYLFAGLTLSRHFQDADAVHGGTVMGMLANGAPPYLPGFLNSLAGPLDHFGYWAVLLFVMIEDFGVPVPGETILIAAAVYAGTGRLNVVAVGVIGFAAAVIGDNIGFAIGHYGGRALVLRRGRYVRLTEERLDKAEAFFRRHGPWIITVARFIEVLRQVNGIAAGTSGMRWLRFLAFNALGAALWVGTWVSLGYLAGSHIDTIYHDITRYSYYVLIALAVVLAVYIARHIWRRRRRRTARASQAQARSKTTGS